MNEQYLKISADGSLSLVMVTEEQKSLDDALISQISAMKTTKVGSAFEENQTPVNLILTPKETFCVTKILNLGLGLVFL